MALRLVNNFFSAVLVYGIAVFLFAFMGNVYLCATN